LAATITPSTAATLVIYCHGAGETSLDAFTNTNEVVVTSALVAAGYIVASSNGGGPNLWGNQTTQDAYAALYTYLAARYNITKVLFVGQSMGGLVSLNLIAAGTVPLVAGWYGIYPAANLASMYSGAFTAQIETAYGFSGGANYAAATSGYDPVLEAAAAYAGIRYRMSASAGDTVVPKATNTDAFVALINGTVPESSILTASGDHGDSSAFNAADVLSFFSRC
jgi:pimeloyl-ACP methyl ester carboxylesterase